VRGAPPPPRFSDPVEPPPEGRPWTVLHLLRWSTRYLEDRGVPEPRLDVEHLLAHALGMGRLELYLHFERPLTPEELAVFRPLLQERARRRPLQYILGTASFRELELAVDERVLIPRPETEELVEAVLQRVREWGKEGLEAADLGTGSGAIALSLAKEGPFRRVYATDRSPEALTVARANAEALGLASRVTFHQGDLFEALPPGTRVHVLVSNPPYVAESELAGLEPEVRSFEPHMALTAPDEGFALLETLLREGADHVLPGGLLALEIGAGQGERVLARLRALPAWEGGVVLRDLARRDRMVLATRALEGPEAGVARSGHRRISPEEGSGS
jgi:release factor glutamine methyltransferase